MRIYLIKEFWDKSWKEVLPVNNWYEGELTPTMYDPQTLQEASPAYIVRCNDGKFRKVDGEYFLTEEDWRERQLNQILSVSL
jgi:hypothetical protein